MRGSESGAPSTVNGQMVPRSTAVVLIGFQNEYFAEGGAFVSDFADASGPRRVLNATVAFLDRVATTDTLIVATPMMLIPGDLDLADPIGLLALIKARGAFEEGQAGARAVEELARFGPRIVELERRRGFSAFSHTSLDESLAARQIRDVVIAGALTCVCIDSTARAAYERGYRVTILSDCTLGRTTSEHRLFCERVFPLYAEVTTSEIVADRLSLSSPSRAPL